MFVLEEMVNKIPSRSILSSINKEDLIEVFHKKLNNDSNEEIAEWIENNCGVSISARQLWNIFRQCIPDMVLKSKNRPNFHDPDDIKGIVHKIEELEKVAEILMDRLKTQYFDELDQMGTPRMNPQTGEVEYSATNKFFNDTARVYNQTVKNIIDMKMSVGLVKKAPEVIQVETGMRKEERDALKDIIMHNLNKSDRLNKFVKSSGNSGVYRDEYESPKQIEGNKDEGETKEDKEIHIPENIGSSSESNK